MPLRPISRIDKYQFPSEAWDVRGWTVRSEIGDEKVGKVEDMLLDGHGRLRYLDVDLGLMKKHILVPLEHAFAERETETVRIEGMTKDQLEEVPEYAVDPETLDDGYERRLAAVYGDTPRAASSSYVDPDAPDDREVELRRMEALEDDYQVAGADPRGWGVVTADGTKVGEVSELLMDPSAMKARFLDVAINEKKLDLEPVDRHILLPVDRVRLDRNKKRVVLGGLLADDVARYPHYGGLPVRSGTVRELETFFDRPSPETRTPGVNLADPVGPEGERDPSLSHFYGRTRGSDPGTAEGRYHG
jgi:ribosomal 30S subunit maturation factor RimM